MSLINEIRNLLEDYSGVSVEDPNIDIYKELGITGDDFHEMIDKYSDKYKVDMSDYLWYFHANEEGSSIGGVFFKPPYKRVERIPVTPLMLVNFIETKKWKIDYPKHETPINRKDISLDLILLILLSITLAVWFLLKYIV